MQPVQVSRLTSGLGFSARLAIWEEPWAANRRFEGAKRDSSSPNESQRLYPPLGTSKYARVETRWVSGRQSFDLYLFSFDRSACFEPPPLLIHHPSAAYLKLLLDAPGTAYHAGEWSYSQTVTHLSHSARIMALVKAVQS